MSAAILEAEGLARSFTGAGRAGAGEARVRRAVDGVDMVLTAGECLALFGPNGAGKTTLLRLLAGLLRPTAGRARVWGVELPGGAEARAMVGVLSHQSMLYAALTPIENVEFAARMYGVTSPRRAAADALSRMGVLDRAGAPVRALSRGLQQRVSVARAIVHAPKVLLLDEPFSGLDDAGAAALTSVLESLKRAGAALVLVTHNLQEGLSLATHAAVMRAGRFVRVERRETIDPAAYASEYRELVARG